MDTQIFAPCELFNTRVFLLSRELFFLHSPSNEMFASIRRQKKHAIPRIKEIETYLL